ncbi:unnamed protein product [Rotaria sp. Silwood2]|nr:unnamed protein product [Rotaria sp. Silwood2]
MPNSYHYFESGEVSHERLLLEIELLKQLQQANLLNNLDWKLYDTFSLKIFHQIGIYEVNDELTQRYRNNSNEYEQYNFISQCIQKHEISSINENFKQQQQTSLIIILNTIFIFICLLFIIGFFIYEYIKYDHKYYLLKLLNHPLTTKRRHLSFTDDLSIILLTFTSSIILGCIIIATRFNRKIILFGIFALLIIVLLLIKKGQQIITILLTYRELRWSMLYDYMYS